MTKAEIRSFVWNGLQKVDKTNKYHDNVIDKAITFAFNQGFNQVFEQSPRNLDNYTVSYGKTAAKITTAVSTVDPSLYEASIPVAYVPFPDKASGVRHVFTETAGTTKFYPMTMYELDMAANTNFGEIDTRIGYCVRRDKILFYRMSAATDIRIHVVQPFDKYADTDVVNIPFGRDVDLISAVLEALRSIPAVDLKDDNTDTPWQTQRQ